MQRYIIGITGASGVTYGWQLVHQLLAMGHEVHLVISPAAELVLMDELCIDVRGWELNQRRALFPPGELYLYAHDDIAARIASGSFICDAMVLIPCSMGSLAALCHGGSDNLIERAGDMMMKERRPLLLVPRETPLSSIHLRNMLRLSEDGVTILPAMPAFYHHPLELQDVVDFVVGKVLDQLKLPHQIFKRYTGLDEGVR